HAQPEDSNELFQKLLDDLKELAKYANSPSRDRSNFFNDNEEHFVQNKEYLENSSNEIATLNSNQEMEKPPQDSDIHQLIREECCIEVCEDQKQNIENTILELVEICRQKELLCIHDNVDDLIENKIIKSGVKELVPIPNENEVTSKDKRECNTPICENSPICDDHSEIYSYSNNDDDISSDDDALKTSKEEFDLEEIQDIVLRKKLLSINRLIANIKSLNDNPTPYRVLNSSISFPIFEESDNYLLDNSSLEFKTFCDHMKETRNGNTTTHANDSLPEYDSFCFEIEPDQERLTITVMDDISDDSTNDPLLEEVDLFLASDNLIPSGIENFGNDSEGDIHFLEALLSDDSIPFLVNEESESDNPSFP
nr:hypothetical protein [Tanacetum cinerariifolium]